MANSRPENALAYRSASGRYRLSPIHAPRSLVPQVNPAILQWARESAGLSLEDASEKLGFASPDRLAGLEAGDRAPSRAQLAKMAKRYRRSLLTFYLREPPRKGDRGEDFRTLPPDRSVSAEALVDSLLRDLKARQGLVRAILEDEEERAALPFVGSMRMEDGVARVVASVRETCRFDLARYRASRTVAEAFAYLRDAVESAGVFVLLIGDLGNYRTALPVELFRGFAVADPIAPFVVINDQDARTAWSFTLLHEIAHLFLGSTGVSAGTPSVGIERFCNDTASELLLPAQDLLGLDVARNMQARELLDRISTFASTRHVSSSMVAYKLHVSGVLSLDQWRTIDRELRQLWLAERARAKQTAGESGPSYYVVRRHRLGRALLDFTSRNLASGALSPTRAARILGVKPRSVSPLLADRPERRRRRDEEVG